MSIEAFALQLATIEQDLQDATRKAEAAAAETRGLQERLDTVLARREEVKGALDNGSLEPRAAGGLLADADEDARDLQALIAEATNRQAGADAVVASAQARHDQASAGLAKAEAGEKYRHLEIKAATLDSLLMSCVAELATMGRAAGRGNDLASLWRPSDRLRQAIQLRVVPQPERTV